MFEICIVASAYWIKKTNTNKLKKIIINLFNNLEMFFKNIHEFDDYQYHVSSTQINCCIELLNILSILQYIYKINYSIVIQYKKWFIIFMHISDVIWLIYMFFLNWKMSTIWLCFKFNQAEKDRILSDFNNLNNTLHVFLLTNLVFNFDINLHLSNCHHIIIAELF